MMEAALKERNFANFARGLGSRATLKFNPKDCKN